MPSLQNLSGDTRFGLIGTDIQGSGSPALFQAAYGGKWPYDLLDGAEFLPLWERFLTRYRAVNVTAPFKQDAFAQALQLARDGYAGISGPCFKIRATNLAVKTPQGLMFHNTDFSGVLISVAEACFPGVTEQCYAVYGDKGHIKVHQFLRENLSAAYGFRPQALVIGCGGAGRAAAVAAAEAGFATALMNRTHSKAEALAAELPEYGFLAVPMSDFTNAVRECDLVIYTLPEAIPAVRLLTAEDFGGEQPGGPAKIILEANYKTPAFAGEVRRKMAAAGCRYVPGQRWLLGQALAGYGLMTGEPADFPAMERALSGPGEKDTTFHP